jgi:hypothetical protein
LRRVPRRVPFRIDRTASTSPFRRPGLGMSEASTR